MSWVTPVLCAAAAAAAGVKWLRVAQREHYLAGSVMAMRRIWLASRRWNLAEPVLLVAAAAGWIVRPELPWALLGGVAVLVLPVGLSFRGRTSPLAWTPRLRRLAVLAGGLLIAGGAALSGVLLLPTGREAPGAVALAVLLVFPFVHDAALWVAAPLEKRLSQRFVDQAAVRLALVDPTVVGITGSYGKTSTKWYVRDLIGGARRTVASPASFNNRLGLARAVNENLTGDAEVFVAEMGAYGPGEIAELCSWIPPSIAVLTAIGPVHLQRFGSEERIVRAKSEMIETARTVVLNTDHPALARLADRTAASRKVWRCGSSASATDVRVLEEGDALAISVRGERIGETAVTGVFASNLACAVAVALELGVRCAEIVDRAGRLTQSTHRQSITRSPRGFTVIDDTFNSNPAGAARALEVLAREGRPGARTVVVTPGMVELGPEQRSANTRFGAAAAAAADDLVIVGRTNLRALMAGARAAGVSPVMVRTRGQAVEWVRENLGPGDVVLYENDLPDHYP